MDIEIAKISQFKSEYKVTRSDMSKETIGLDTKTYLIHDISHYVVEKQLNFQNGFWGMLSNGYKFQELFGKENELTEELRFVEKIVGPIQSVYMGYFKIEEFNVLISHIDFSISISQLGQCVEQIKYLNDKWRNLQIGDKISLKW